MFKVLEKFFDRLEDNVRNHLSHYPIIYAFIAGVGIVLFWRGVWHTADLFAFMTGPVSTVIGVIILLMAGLFVSFFIGDSIIIAGIRREKKLVERTELEIETEKEELDEVRGMVREMKKEVDEIEDILEENNKRP
ncbi:hypothetical protein A3C86_04435 [Candidatus Kaiserbacteria bacterium RIFCSPHIGHO2_02_FULL_49_16]|uniref:Uncharacterized protein n=1 Tax=Candidatus Kaiserbacteria bacterium RIFCSPHIGHO2_02_FULL_49_16 TaxID=1798490 RepID=A0A1F6D9W5_9BACT|nr:MAG: hypothetical protein A3C86_04435 [Candidatus Kaiserbacteria bacterium RIFCSPHIGHO2_02_FULL_49_16]